MKQEQMLQKVRNAKRMRDRQLEIEHKRKSLEDQTKKAEEAEQVRRLKKELQFESEEAIRKKKEDMRRMNMIVAENDKQREMRDSKAAREKEEDAKAQLQYMEILDKQERDKALEYQKREARVKENMNRMTGSVMKKIDERNRKEEETIQKYIKQREF